MIKKILITGGAGYLGSILTYELLKLNYEVTVVDNFLYNQVSINHLVAYDNLKIIKGDVRETLTIEKNLPEKISLLRLDTDFYESTKKELEVLYPKLVKGGILIVDDYGFFSGSKKAVDEFLENKNIFFFPVDDYIRICLKLWN